MSEITKKDPIQEYTNKHFNVYSREVDFGDFTKKYYVANFGYKAGILIIKDGSVLLVRQYRLLPDQYSWEIPGGKIEKDEEPQVSAVRECEEETGIRCRNIQPLINYRAGLDAINGGANLFYTNEFEALRPFEPNPKEVDMMKWTSLAECFELIKSGKIVDHFTLIALFYYRTFINPNCGKT